MYSNNSLLVTGGFYYTAPAAALMGHGSESRQFYHNLAQKGAAYLGGCHLKKDELKEAIPLLMTEEKLKKITIHSSHVRGIISGTAKEHKNYGTFPK